VALRAVGLPNKAAHFIKRPGDVAMFGWTEADAPEITPQMHDQLDQAELLTDRIVAPAYAVLGDAAREAFVTGLHAVQAALTA
jgi:hypothetical protein